MSNGPYGNWTKPPNLESAVLFWPSTMNRNPLRLPETCTMAFGLVGVVAAGIGSSLAIWKNHEGALVVYD